MDSDRFMDIEMEGSNEALLEGIRQIASRSPSRPVARQIATSAVPQKAASNENGSSVPAQTDLGFESPETMIEEPHVDREPVAASPVRPRAPRRFVPPELSTGLGLDDTPTLKEFITTTTVNADSGHADKAIAFATFLQKHRQLPMSGPDLYTCYKHMDWLPTSDYTSPARSLKQQGKFTSDSGRFVLTTGGEKHFATLKAK